MAQIIITIPNDQIDRVVTAYSGVYHYQPFLYRIESGIYYENSESPSVFAKRQLINSIRETTKQYEIMMAVNAARAAADASATLVDPT